jgi:CubicO group peptidase (beta-lactamase class C family)
MMRFRDTGLARLMEEADVPGAALAVVRDGQGDELLNFGIRGVQDRRAVDADTVFDAASLSKPVFAFIVLQLVDRGVLALGDRVADHLAGYIADPRASAITVSHVLSHGTGLPNWRNPDYPLRTWFAPGERFSYSGEGFLFLQKAVEALTGEGLDLLARRLVFEPLAMHRSRFVWQEDFCRNCALPHDAFGAPALFNKPGLANAASSLQTCAADYAKFLRAVLDGARLGDGTRQCWLKPHAAVNHHRPQCLDASDEDVATGVAWGLGWGLEPASGTFFHWGDNGAFKAFTIGSVTDRAALVVFLNGASGLAVVPDIVARFMPGERPALTWLDYPRHGAPVRRLYRAALTQGPQAVWDEIEALDREQKLWIAQGLNVRGRISESAWLRARIDPKQAGARLEPG